MPVPVLQHGQVGIRGPVVDQPGPLGRPNSGLLFILLLSSLSLAALLLGGLLFLRRLLLLFGPLLLRGWCLSLRRLSVRLRILDLRNLGPCGLGGAASGNHCVGNVQGYTRKVLERLRSKRSKCKDEART